MYKLRGSAVLNTVLCSAAQSILFIFKFQ